MPFKDLLYAPFWNHITYPGQVGHPHFGVRMKKKMVLGYNLKTKAIIILTGTDVQLAVVCLFKIADDWSHRGYELTDGSDTGISVPL